MRHIKNPLAIFERVDYECPVCGSTMLQVYKPDDEDAVVSCRNTYCKLNEREMVIPRKRNYGDLK